MISGFMTRLGARNGDDFLARGDGWATLLAAGLGTGMDERKSTSTSCSGGGDSGAEPRIRPTRINPCSNTEKLHAGQKLK